MSHVVLHLIILRPVILHPIILRTSSYALSSYVFVILRPASWRPTPTALHPIILPFYLFIRCSFYFWSTFVQPSFDVHLTSFQRSSVVNHSQRHTRFFKLYVVLELCSQCFVLLQNFRHGTTPCLQMMKVLLLNQSPSINYEVTHNPLSEFLYGHDLHNVTIKHQQHQRHLVQRLLGIQVQVTLHQRYIRVHFGGAHQWGTPVAAPIFTPSPYISL